MDYTGFIVPNCPPTVIYIPNFISTDEEYKLLNYVASAPKPKWTHLTNRRLINYGGIPHKNGMIAEIIPKWLQDYIDKINNLGIFDKNANHCLVNEYLPGQGIMAHLDGPLFHPTIATISCGSHTILDFHRQTNTDIENSNINNNNNNSIDNHYADNSDNDINSINGDDANNKQINGINNLPPSPTTSISVSLSSSSSSSASSSTTTTTSSLSRPRQQQQQQQQPQQQQQQLSNKDNKYICRLLIEPRSLLILKDDLYHKYKHSISEVDEDFVCDYISNIKYCGNNYKLGDVLKRNKRISLTIRHVPKTSKMKLNLGN